MDNFNTEEYKNLLNKDEDPLKDYPMEDEVIDAQDCEVIPPSGIDMLKGATIQGLPLGAEETIRSGRDLMKKKAAEANKIAQAFGNLFSTLNNKYGYNFQWDQGSFAQNLVYMMTLQDMRAVELYISDAYSKTRVFLYQQFLGAITTLASEVMDPNYLLSSSLSFDDKMTTIEKLFGFIQQMNEIYEQVRIDNVDDKLKHLKEESDAEETLSIRDKGVRDFLDAFRKQVLSGNTGKQENPNN